MFLKPVSNDAENFPRLDQYFNTDVSPTLFQNTEEVFSKEDQSGVQKVKMHLNKVSHTGFLDIYATFFTETTFLRIILHFRIGRKIFL